MRCQFGLKLKITLAFSVLVIFLISAIAFIVLSYFEKQLKTTIAQNQFVMVTGLAGEIDKKLTAAHNQLINAALRIPQEAIENPDRAQSLLESMTGLKLIFEDHISFLTPEGKIFAETPFRSDRRGFDLSMRPYFTNTASSKKPVISEPYRTSLPDNHPLVVMTAPVFKKNGDLAGVLLGAMDLMDDNILKDTSKIAVGRTGYISLTSTETGNVIMHPDANQIFKPIPAGIKAVYDKAVAGFEGTDETVDEAGVRMLTSLKRLKVNGWILATNYPISEAHEIIFNLKKKIFVVAAIGTVGILILVFYLIEYLTFPLVTFTKHIEALPEKTGKDKFLDIVTHDEIGTLSQAFNRMISELDRQKEVLQEREKQYRTIYDSANDAIFIQDMDTGAILDVNQKMCQMYGYDSKEVRQLDIGVLSAGEPPYTLEEALDWISKAAGGEQQIFEWKAKDKTGHLFWVEVKMKRVRIGKTDRLLVTVRDITDSKQAKQALHEAEKRLANVIKAASLRR
jgi:PAS domain S-box-containing protein